MVASRLAESHHVFISTLQGSDVARVRYGVATQPTTESGDRRSWRFAVLDHLPDDVIKPCRVLHDMIRKMKHGPIRHLDPNFASTKETFGVPLQTVAQIYRYRQARGAVLQAFVPDGQKIGDARDGDRDRMHVNTNHPLRACGQGLVGRHPRGIGCLKIPAHGVEQKGARPAGRVQDTLVQWVFNRTLAHPSRQPVRGIILTKVVALLWVDERLVQDLQNVVLYVAQAKSADLMCEAHDEALAFWCGKNPIKEVRFYGTSDSSTFEGYTAEQSLRFRGSLAEYACRHRLCDYREISVLEKEVVASNTCAVHLLQVIVPKLSFDLDVRPIANVSP